MSDLTAAKFTNLFAAPLVAHVWDDAEDLNDSLRASILAHATNSPGESKTNEGGWHSTSGQLEFCGEPGRRLVSRMYQLADEATHRVLSQYGHQPKPMRWTLHAWANVNGPAHFNRMHTHPGSTWSGTYYVDTGYSMEDSKNSTPLHLFDPCQGHANSFLPPLVPSSFLIKPEAGLMVLFPSYVPHMVFAHQGSKPRISVAFNLRKEPFP